MRHFAFIILLAILGLQAATGQEVLRVDTGKPTVTVENARAAQARPDTSSLAMLRRGGARPSRLSLYDLPYSMTANQPNWKRLWINTAIFTGAYIGTLTVLECLPEGATNWNRTTIQSTPWYKRWTDNVIHKGPEWDGDDVVFNYLLHPYAGAVYFMAARSAGFNFYRSLLYCSLVSTVGWEFGIEGTMERPSIQDIFITPLVGSLVGELFYHAKRYILANDYRLLGSPVLGHIACFILDPVNEIVDLFGRDPARLPRSHRAVQAAFTPTATAGSFGFAMQLTF